VEALPNASWVDLMDKFSENGICKFLPDGSFPYADLYHLNFLGIRYLIEDELGELLLQGFAPMHSECEADRKSVYK
jgi:hypothetical protein